MDGSSPRGDAPADLRGRPVATLSAADAPEVVAVLAEAFAGYPVMRWVLGADAADGPRMLHALVRFFVIARVLRGETMLGIAGAGGLDAAALVSRPGGPNPPELREERERLWAELGAAARGRYAAYAAAAATFAISAPHVHLDMIGVRTAARRAGLGRSLIERVHALSAADPASTGVTLTTESPANVPLYEHFGYRLLGRARVAAELRTWGFYRPDA